MKRFFLGILIGLCLPLAGAYVFLIFGGMPVATKGPPLPMERFVARTALHAAMKGEEDKPSPVSADEVNLLKGARVYMNHCAVCHGDVSGQPTAFAKGLFPKPPQLLEKGHGVTDDPVGESYWKVKNGIRLTGMPGFGDSLSESELWQVSQFVANADKLSADVKQVLHRTLGNP
jgi:thiosulfate dehydrogenase